MNSKILPIYRDICTAKYHRIIYLVFTVIMSIRLVDKVNIYLGRKVHIKVIYGLVDKNRIFTDECNLGHMIGVLLQTVENWKIDWT